MKLKIMIMALLLLLAGIGSAVNRLPATEFTGDIDFMDGYYARNATEGIVNVKDYGAVGDGVTDDGPVFRAVFGIDGATVIVPSGVYAIDISSDLDIANNVTIINSAGTVYKALGHNLTAYNFFDISGKSNVTIVGGVIDGNKSGNAATSGESGYGVRIMKSHHIKIIDTEIKDCWGDGIYISCVDAGYHSHNISIVRPEIHGCRRQGISVIDAIDLDIIDSNIYHINGTTPGCGMDFEPTTSAKAIDRIRIINPSTRSNYGPSLKFDLTNIDDSDHSIHIDVVNHVDDSGTGPKDPEYCSIYFIPLNNVSGYIRIDSGTSQNSPGRAWRMSSTSGGPLLVASDLVAINPGLAGDATGVVIDISTSTRTPGDEPVGNVRVNGLVIHVDSGIDPYRLITIYEGRSGSKPNNITITGVCGDMGMAAYNYVMSGSQDITIKTDDDVIWYPNAAANYESRHTDVIDNRDFSADRTLTLKNVYPVGLSTTFRISNGSYYMTLDPEGTIVPTGNGTGKYIRSKTVGSSVTLKKTSTTTWTVTNLVGTWEAEA